jgi:hypothetical protein
MVLSVIYNEKCLAHIMKVMMEEVLQKPTFVVLYGSILEECRSSCLDCTALAFRRVILLAIEDAGVKLLHAQNETLNKRLLHKMGWAKYQQEQRDGAGGTGGSKQMTYYDMINDKDSYMDFKRFRDDCKAMQGLVRELFEVHGILLEDDMRDIAAGFPGSQHSIGIIDSEEARKKSTFFASLSRWKSRFLSSLFTVDDADAMLTARKARGYISHVIFQQNSMHLEQFSHQTLHSFTVITKSFEVHVAVFIVDHIIVCHLFRPTSASCAVPLFLLILGPTHFVQQPLI